MSRRICREPLITRVSIERRRVCQWLLLPAVAWWWNAANAATIASARLWPAQEYTRVILESPAPIAYQLHTLKNPERLVLDLEGVEPTGDLDKTSAEEVLGLMDRLNRELNKTILMVTHDPRAAERARVVRHLEKGELATG